jgi:hypothetical protein
MTSSGNIRPFYGPVIHDKCKTADLPTLQAYKTVVEDLVKGGGADDLKDSLKELDAAIAAKKKY